MIATSIPTVGLIAGQRSAPAAEPGTGVADHIGAEGSSVASS